MTDEALKVGDKIIGTVYRGTDPIFTISGEILRIGTLEETLCASVKTEEGRVIILPVSNINKLEIQ